MTNERTIPALPCKSIDDIVTFYTALGFEITYRQAKPNNYAVVKRGDIELHFFTMKGYEPAQSYSTCLVLVPDVDAIHQAFAAGLKQHYGKVPMAGIPRINKPNNNNAGGDRRFNVIDPGGNWVRFIQLASAEEKSANEDASSTLPATKLSRATHAANLLSDSKGDYEAAAKMLDAALAQADSAPVIHRVQALIARASIAVTMEDTSLAASLLSTVRQIELEADDRDVLREDLEKASELEQFLQ